MKYCYCRKILALVLAIMTIASVFVFPASAATDSIYFDKYTGSSKSIVTALKAVGADSSYSFRSRIAAANGISGYRGSASQNTKMLNLLKQGKLINPDARQSAAPATENYFPRYTGSSGSIVVALSAIGVDSSYSYRCKIATSNNISDYKGTASQNLYMLELLKKGTLLKPTASTSNSGSNNSQNQGESTQVEENGVNYTYVTVTLDTTSLPAWIESLMRAESKLDGIIVARTVDEYKSLTIEEPLQGPPVNGKYPTKKTTIDAPYQVTFKVHKHEREMGFGASLRYAGGCFISMYKCNCGYMHDLVVWEIPLADPSEFAVNQIKQTIHYQSQQSYWINNMH